MNLSTLHSVFFLGIGGIGMSALARYFNNRGVKVAGFDKTATPLTNQLICEGMDIHFEDDVDLIPKDIDLVVLTPAIPDSHQQLEYLKQSTTPILLRAQVLGLITKSSKAIAVAGTHGKTSTSSLLTYMLKEGGVDVTAFLGGIVSNYNSNYIEGSSDWVVVEADEYNKSFLELYPAITIINSMDPDHLDIYGSEEHMVETYNQFVLQTDKGGLVLYKSDVEFKKQSEELNFVPVGNGNMYSNIRIESGVYVFDYEGFGRSIKNISTVFPGEHNIQNAAAAISVAINLGVSETSIRASLLSFKGIQRRFEYIINTPNCVFIDDYAHHPEELKAAISATRMLYKERKITGIFQPHLFTRTRDFLAGFADALSLLDEVVVLPIYPARELPIEGVRSERIVELMKGVNVTVLEKHQLKEYVSSNNVEVLMTLGAGDIAQEVEGLKEVLLTHKTVANDF